mmetsp:Transcript_12166/g.18677  ORF Transcript_12166/g.18677 Transcript_12166/m.18677 type:complete len:445 (-) Transcript_12166:46-1380(-)
MSMNSVVALQKNMLQFAILITVVHCFSAPSIPTKTSSSSLSMKVPRGATKFSDATAEILDADFTTMSDDGTEQQWKNVEQQQQPNTPFEQQQQQHSNNDDAFGREERWDYSNRLNDIYYNDPNPEVKGGGSAWYEQTYSTNNDQQQQQSDFYYGNVKQNHANQYDQWHNQPFGYYNDDGYERQQNTARTTEPHKSADPNVVDQQEQEEQNNSRKSPSDTTSSTANNNERNGGSDLMNSNFDEEQRAFREHLLIHEMTRHIDKLNKENRKLRDTVESLHLWDTVTMTWEIADFDRRLSESRTVFHSDEFLVGGYNMKLELNVMSKEESNQQQQEQQQQGAAVQDRDVGFYFIHTGGSSLMPIEMDGSKVTVIGAESFTDAFTTTENNLKTFEAGYGFKIDAVNGGFGWSDIGTLSELRHGGYLTVDGSLVLEAQVRIKKVRHSVS